MDAMSRNKLALVLSLVALAGCSSSAPETTVLGVEVDNTPTIRSVAGQDGAVDTATAEPAFCGSDLVLSENSVDTAAPVSVDELSAWLATNTRSAPDGFRAQAVVVDQGVGSFRIAIPDGFSNLWRFGAPPHELVAMAAERDQEVAAYWDALLRRADVNPRAISLDSSRSDELVSVKVTLTPEESVTGAALAARFAGGYGSAGMGIAEYCGAVVNGAEGAYVEHVVPGRWLDSPQDRYQMQFLIPDPGTRSLWGVTCDVPRSVASDVKELCAQIASTFQPLPRIG